ncbi:MAG: hypothetical protein M3Y57_02780 [Acidobacteriota bacterium]|nr:hypothetical protein [Acidobacteriota bacterium]
MAQRLAEFAPFAERETIPPFGLHEQEARSTPFSPDRNSFDPGRQIEIHSEFDRYASGYSDLLRNPLRDLFATNELFFHRRKWEILQDGLRARRFPIGQARWLDADAAKVSFYPLGSGHLLSLSAAILRRR